ncbi:MAG: hypothetical protein NVS2B8_02660 [Vulcanimicrobiaceae bacterium]
MKRKRTLLALLAIAVVLVVAGTWSATHRGSSDAVAKSVQPPSSPSVVLATARTGDFVERVTAQGRIGPPAGSSAKLAFAQSGIVRTVHVRVGESVRVGDAVAELDRASLAAAVAQAEADARSAAASYSGGDVSTATVDSAIAKLSVAREKLAALQRDGPAAQSSQISARSIARQAAVKVGSDRATIARDRELLAGGVLARKDIDAARAQLASDEADQRAADAKVSLASTDFTTSLAQARADVASARNDVEVARAQRGVLSGALASARAKLETARIAYTNGVLTAPTDGIVLSIAKHPGESVDPAQPVMEIGPGLGHGVTLSVPADVARRIVVGDVATLRISPSRRPQTSGRVTAVVPAVDPTTQLATVVVSGAPADVVPGDAVSATIVVGHTPGVIVPSSAIVQDPQSGKTVVFVREAHPKAGESGFALREVAVRASDAATAAVATGLHPGERIASQGGYALLAPAGG